MGLERRIIKLNEEIARLDEQRRLVAEELVYHEHLNDDAQRDAAVSDNPMDRADARATSGDVTRFRRSIAAIDRKLSRAQSKRDALVAKLR